MPVHFKSNKNLTTTLVAVAFALSAGVVAAGETGAATGALSTPAKTSVQKKPVRKVASRPSAEIKKVQVALNRNGASLKVDGWLGHSTRAALKSYQKAKGLKETGHLDGQTRKLLLGA